ncbi:hypothetical protein E2C01_068592 [Portunus trituberculatus]|uniref:Uncharacterized protein n=1 Tax=Portunus trituberculatus TaxID=210409 RepID=A0A5B7HWV1_PORTR|nr:hypothetical protein [Portunus trituberculatus]
MEEDCRRRGSRELGGARVVFWEVVRDSCGTLGQGDGVVYGQGRDMAREAAAVESEGGSGQRESHFCCSGRASAPVPCPNYCGGPAPPRPSLPPPPPPPPALSPWPWQGRPLHHQADRRPHLPCQNTPHISAVSRNSLIYYEALKPLANGAASRRNPRRRARRLETKGRREEVGACGPPHRRLRFTAR